MNKINWIYDFTFNLKDHITTCFSNANGGVSKINQTLKDMEGMSGLKTRHFYNNLLDMPDARYLEIGTWKGSSVCSAMYGNKAKVVCIDNWSEFGGPKSEFMTNFNNFKGHNEAYFIESDCFKVNVSNLPKFNIYMYDGNHTEDSHYKALSHYLDCLDDEFIFIVDDWNWKDVREGTKKCIKDLDITIKFDYFILTSFDDGHPAEGSELKKDWHNGIYVALLKKNSS
jgi:hypothetical protein